MSTSFSVPAPAPLELKAGQKIAATIYQGNNNIEAKTLLDYLKPFKDSGTPMPLSGTIFDIKIENVFTENFNDHEKNAMVYKVIIRGELLNASSQPAVSN